ncbi:MAG: hypothetical protein AAF484_09750 [Pseudomonadota bacterium]
MTRALALPVVLIWLSGPAPAQTCGWVEALVSGQVSPDMAEGAVCTTEDQIVCRWDFAYRATAAGALFDTLSETLSACLDPADAPAAPVNHPDSYAQRQYRAAQTAVSVALKDKAGLDKSFVFLRVDRE